MENYDSNFNIPKILIVEDECLTAMELKNKQKISSLKLTNSINPLETSFYKQFSDKNNIHLNDEDLSMNNDFFNLTSSCYFILDKKGLILNVNSRGSELLGKKKKSMIIEKEFKGFVVPTFRQQYQSMLNNSIITNLKQKKS